MCGGVAVEPEGGRVAADDFFMEAVLISVVTGEEETFVVVDSVAVDVADGVVEETEPMEDGTLSLVVNPDSVCVVLAGEGITDVVGSKLVLVIVKAEVLTAGPVDLGSFERAEAVVVVVWSDVDDISKMVVRDVTVEVELVCGDVAVEAEVTSVTAGDFVMGL